jgi:glycosyltransferase involved in cell wall biosynthesis
MKIAMIGQKGILKASFGGVERHVEELSTRLGVDGHDVIVYARKWYSKVSSQFAKGVRVILTPSIHTKNLDAITHTFTSTFHAIWNRVDVIHYHGIGPALLAWIPRVFAPRTKVIVTFHSIDRMHAKWGWFARLMLTLGERAAAIFPHETITVSRVMKKYIKNNFGVNATYIPNGTVIAPAKIGTSTLKQFGLVKGKYIAMVSRLVRHKGAHTLIEAFHILKRQGKADGIKLAIVGDTAFTDSYIRELKDLAGGDKNIVFTGYQTGTTIHQLYANSYMVVHPSVAEGLPITVLEAMGYGKTVIATDIPEHKEVLDADTGMMFHAGNAEDLAAKMAIALRNHRAVVQMGERARKYVLENYNWNDITVAVEKVYAKALAVSSEKQSVSRAGHRAVVRHA